MKLYIITLFLISINFGAYSQDANTELRNIQKALSEIETVNFRSERELNFATNNYQRTNSWTCFYDFRAADSLVGTRFQIEDENSLQIYNGTEKFDLDKDQKTIEIIETPLDDNFSSLSALYNSLLTLKNSIPFLLADLKARKSIKDTLIQNERKILLTVNLGKRRIQNLGFGFDKMETDFDFLYKICVDPETHLPTEVWQGNSQNTDYIKTRFTHFEINGYSPEENTWFYSSYLKDYGQIVMEKIPEIIAAGETAPNFSLKTPEGETISLNKLKGKVVLLDFWIKNCGPCIKSVPYLNKIQDKFSDREFVLLGVNSYDNLSDISWFKEKYKMEYPILTNGNTTAKEYGVYGYPAMVILDKNGKVNYAHTGFSPSENQKVENMISQLLDE